MRRRVEFEAAVDHPNNILDQGEALTQRMRAELFDKIDARFGVLQARVDAILPETKGSFARSASCPTRCRPPRDQLMLDRPDAQSSARFIDLTRCALSVLSGNDIALVRASFARVVPIQDAAADLFYDRLFAVSPKLRELFPADLREQKRKLIQMIATAVGGLNDLDKLVPAVKALGARHSGYGVTAAHYKIVGEALLWTLERGLGDDFTPEVRSAWGKIYGVLSATMQAGAAEVADLRAAE